jgi:hypothetical protein
MADGILIDEKGRRWPDSSFELIRRLGAIPGDVGLAVHAVCDCGFIHIRPHGTGARVALRPGGFSLEALAGALYELKERHIPRILLALFIDGEWFYEMLGGAWEFAERAERVLAGGPVVPHQPWLAAERTLGALNLPDFAAIRPLVKLWRATRGRMPDELEGTLIQAALLDRMILLRPRGSGLVFAHLGSAIECVRPGQNLLLVDRDIHEQPDRDYGAWVARAYDENLRAGRPQLQSIRATVRLSETTAAQGRYDRLTLPWHASNGNRFLMGISLTREHRCVVDRPRQVG